MKRKLLGVVVLVLCFCFAFGVHWLLAPKAQQPETVKSYEGRFIRTFEVRLGNRPEFRAETTPFAGQHLLIIKPVDDSQIRGEWLEMTRHPTDEGSSIYTPPEAISDWQLTVDRQGRLVGLSLHKEQENGWSGVTFPGYGIRMLTPYVLEIYESSGKLTEPHHSFWFMYDGGDIYCIKKPVEGLGSSKTR